MKTLGPKLNLFIVIATCVLLLISSLLYSCTSPSPLSSPAQPAAPAVTGTTPVSTPATSTPLKEAWAADGIIKQGEYSGAQTYGQYMLYWRADGQLIYIGITAGTGGWVSLAIQPGTGMKDADMVIGFVKDGKAEIQDAYCTDNLGTHPSDTKLGGTEDIITFGGKEEGGSITMEFQRRLDTGDKYDIPFKPGINKIMWAYGSGDSFILKHSIKGYGEINLD